jgi:hypothetical protein
VWTLRTAALMGAGTFVVHQLRFAISGGHGGGGAAAVQGHGYLVPLGPILAGLLLLAFAAGLGRVARGAHEPAPRFRRLWAGASGSLFAVYCVQETIEGIVTAGHHSGLHMPLAHGGWVALPLSVGVGLVIALITRGAAAASALVAARAPWRPSAPVATLQVVLPPWSPRRTRGRSLHLAARGPPAVLV